MDIDRNRITLANWRGHPQSRWSFRNVCELVPCAVISHERAEAGAEGPGTGLIERLTLRDASGTSLPCFGLLAARHTDSLWILRDSKPLAEWHAPHSTAAQPHIVFSISKSFTGLLAGIAAADGALDPEAPVTRYVPSMAGSAYDDATVRHLLDMTVDVDFDEDYADLGGPFDRYRRAMLWNPERPGTEPETMEGFLASLQATGEGHGRRFRYASPNTDLLGLVIERATGMRLHRFLRERLWLPLGATDPAYVTIDRVGTARAAGGICVSVRDLARLGQMVLDGGRGADGRQVVPETWLADIASAGDRAAWVSGDFAGMFDNGRYRSCWYDVGDGRGTLAAVGIHGQYLWIDRASRLVIARTASRPLASDDAETAADIALMSGLAQALAAA